MKNKSHLLLIVLIVFMLVATACSSSASNTTSSSVLDGKTLVDTKCSTCHNLDRIQNAHKDADGWKSTVERMVGKGAELTSEEQATVIDYLAKTYP